MGSSVSLPPSSWKSLYAVQRGRAFVVDSERAKNPWGFPPRIPSERRFVGTLGYACELGGAREIWNVDVAKGALEAGLQHHAKDKKKHRGGFSSGFMLRKTATPHSLPKRSTPSAMDFGQVNDTTPKIVISEAADLPSVPNYRRPDRRQVDQESEKLLTFETELIKLTELTEKAKFLIPEANGMLEALSLVVEVTRRRSVLRGVIRLRPERITSADTASDDQLRIEFPDETTV